ncbi:MAG: 3-oxoacyl-[acyl-carrier-protein] reductase [Candidatus Delongbacteria bacterium]|jgi:3-oxoacyl-[acyl-carrier protein] reductase|nr:3-oxoacyl-[acyl-carrier-protein] reductase [Candidatus Delongbacteria bacterium]
MLKDKVAIITGSARGIGKAIAEEYAKNGAKVVISDILQELADETAKELQEKYNVETLAIKADVSKFKEVEALVKGTIDKFGSIDIIVNNAGITRDNLIMRMSEDEWNLVIDINLKGVFNCIKAVTRPMMKQRAGKIINITSVVGQMGNAGQINYSASKAGVIGMTKTSAKELGSRGIKVNAIAPGFIVSEMTDKMTDQAKDSLVALIPAKKLGHPSDIANAAVFLASDKADYITGQVINVDGGMVMQG